MLGVYIHIPFCEKKCAYCAFSSFVSSREERKKYVKSLIDEIKDFANENKQEKYRKVDTIYIGGGTPSLLELDLLEMIISTLNQAFELSSNLEFTIECNPNSLTEEKLDFYKKLGINRISLGVQSLDDEQLEFVGRLHNKDIAISAIKNSLEKFDNVSIDLLIGIRGMNKKKYMQDLETLVNLGVKHISTYMLQVEKGTPLAKMVESNVELLPSEEDCVDVYEETALFLKNKGFKHYEVSNFAKYGYESKHNYKYWTGEDYIGFGLSAHSYINGERKANANTFEGYYTRKLAMQETLTDKQRIEEHIMLGLRCDKGVDTEFLKQLGYDITKNDSCLDFIQKGLLIEDISNNKVFLNPEYYCVNNYIIVQLLP